MKKKKIILEIISVLILLSLIIVGLFFIFKSIHIQSIKDKIAPVIEIEYGNKVTINDLFLTDPPMNYKTTPDLETITSVGTHNIDITTSNTTFTVTVVIKDTTSPSVETQNLTKYIDEELPTAEDFILSISDLSEYQIEPLTITKTPGEQTVEIKVQDIYDNQTIKIATLTLLEDLTPPTIEGLSDVVIEEGERPNLTIGVVAKDDRFGKVPFTYDDSSVNYNKPGDYTITYQATDSVGNQTTAIRKLRVKAKDITYLIQNFPVSNQYPNYPNGCETIALYNLLRYYGINITAEELIEKLKKGDGPYLEDEVWLGGNPEIEFVGDPRDIHGYGVFQKPIIDLASEYKTGMIDYTGHSLNEVLELVKQQIPVQVWISIGAKDTDVCAEWIYTPTNEKISWICDLHSVVITGFNSTSVYVSDSFTGKIEIYNRQQFEKVYNQFGKRAIYFPN